MSAPACNSEVRDSRPVRYKHLGAWFVAVTAASAAYILFFFGPGAIASASAGASALHTAWVVLCFFVATWTAVLLATALPFAAAVLMARVMELECGLFYVIGALVSATGLAALFAAMPDLGLAPGSDMPLEFGGKMLRVIPASLAAGLLGGLVCWRRVRRSGGASAIVPA